MTKFLAQPKVIFSIAAAVATGIAGIAWGEGGDSNANANAPKKVYEVNLGYALAFSESKATIQALDSSLQAAFSNFKGKPDFLKGASQANQEFKNLRLLENAIAACPANTDGARRLKELLKNSLNANDLQVPECQSHTGLAPIVSYALDKKEQQKADLIRAAIEQSEKSLARSAVVLNQKFSEVDAPFDNARALCQRDCKPETVLELEKNLQVFKTQVSPIPNLGSAEQIAARINEKLENANEHLKNINPRTPTLEQQAWLKKYKADFSDLLLRNEGVLLIAEGNYARSGAPRDPTDGRSVLSSGHAGTSVLRFKLHEKFTPSEIKKSVSDLAKLLQEQILRNQESLRLTASVGHMKTLYGREGAEVRLNGVLDDLVKNQPLAVAQALLTQPELTPLICESIAREDFSEGRDAYLVPLGYASTAIGLMAMLAALPVPVVGEIAVGAEAELAAGSISRAGKLLIPLNYSLTAITTPMQILDAYSAHSAIAQLHATAVTGAVSVEVQQARLTDESVRLVGDLFSLGTSAATFVEIQTVNQMLYKAAAIAKSAPKPAEIFSGLRKTVESVGRRPRLTHVIHELDSKNAVNFLTQTSRVPEPVQQLEFKLLEEHPERLAAIQEQNEAFLSESCKGAARLTCLGKLRNNLRQLRVGN